ncbi:hypothetical protein FS749_008990, partial [Ceratobasidium sp. UAMH 11750]
CLGWRSSLDGGFKRFRTYSCIISASLLAVYNISMAAMKLKAGYLALLNPASIPFHPLPKSIIPVPTSFWPGAHQAFSVPLCHLHGRIDTGDWSREQGAEGDKLVSGRGSRVLGTIFGAAAGNADPEVIVGLMEFEDFNVSLPNPRDRAVQFVQLIKPSSLTVLRLAPASANRFPPNVYHSASRAGLRRDQTRLADVIAKTA